MRNSFDCPEDGAHLECIGEDERQEWAESEFVCPECDRHFLRRIEFETQSSLIKSDKFKEIKNGR